MSDEKENRGGAREGAGRKPSDDPADGTVQFRCKMREKSAWVKAARKSGMKLTPWIIDQLNKAARNQIMNKKEKSNKTESVAETGKSSELNCGNCGLQLLPSLSKQGEIGSSGRIRAQCHLCGKSTDYFNTQEGAVNAWNQGKWAQT